ncbi:MAG TPA: glycoside hydrolase family 5 protein, partial [Polyangiaceae bacterium]
SVATGGSSMPKGLGGTTGATLASAGGAPSTAIGGSSTGGTTGNSSATRATGGLSSAGGTSTKGGASSTSGASGVTGGASSVPVGGTSARGGASSTGGSSAKGGSSTLPVGGTSTRGGASSTGGAGEVAGGTPGSGGGSGDVITKATKASEVVAAWTFGWNLGNSLDADGCGGAGAETCWGNQPSTQALFNYIATLGIKVVRIPVTWSEHLGTGPNYTIDATWMARVDTVVNYALKAGLSAIINLHHDGADGVANIQWINIVDSSGNVTDANTKAVTTKFTAVWTQVANHFKDYDNHLAFESMNEIHHGYDTPQVSWYGVVNSLNQAFVTLVRGTGGNNAQRFLVVPGYNTNIDQTVAGFTLPTDTVANHLILSFHYYDPYQFTLSNEIHTWGAAFSTSGTWGQEDYVRAQFDKIKTTYIDKGLPVIMGEYDAAFQSAASEDYRRYWIEYVTKAAHDRGIAPILWDAGQELVNRDALSIRYSDVYDALKRATTSSYTLSQVAGPK